MSNSTRYFQLTSDILLEYNYAGLDEAINMEGNSEYVYDLYDGTNALASVISSKYNTCRNLLFDIDSQTDYKSGFTIPTNSSESRFIQCIRGSSTIWGILSDNITATEITGLKSENTSDILFDKMKLHFTSRNYMGDYDGLIINVTIYDKIKNKVSLLSHYIRRTDEVNINPNPLLINQKLYTTYLKYEIPSTYAMTKQIRPGVYVLAGEYVFSMALSPEYGIMENTPMVFSIYGVKSKYEHTTTGFEIYNIEKLNSIYVPIYNKFEKLNVVIKEMSEEQDGGDYFEIYPVVGENEMSFSDYIYNISDGRPETYIIFHDLTLTEHYINNQNQVISRVTHREQYIVNAAQDDDGVTINEDELDMHMIYRPVILNSPKIVRFTIKDQMKILNTLDNTTIIKESTLDYGGDSEGNENPKKYGKKMIRIYMGEIPTKVNVYNRRPDEDTDNVRITNSGSNVTIENHQHSIVGFIESMNVGVSIEQIQIESINE